MLNRFRLPFDTTELLWPLIIGSISVVLLALLRQLFLKLGKKENLPLNQIMHSIALHTHPVLFFPLFANSASLFFPISPEQVAFLNKASTIGVLFQIGLWGHHLIAWYVNLVANKSKRVWVAGAEWVAISLFRMAFWAVLVLFLLDNLEFEIYTIIAGLGLGGIAAAFALENLLKDLFGFLSIQIDQPFLVGERIMVGDQFGAVEKIGWRTTRVRSITGELLVYCNSDLLKSQLRNFTRMKRRRMVFHFQLPYGTDLQILRQVPTWIEESVGSADKVEFERAHFRSFADSGLEFEVVYFVKSGDISVARQKQEIILNTFSRKLMEERVVFAYPTQLVQLVST